MSNLYANSQQLGRAGGYLTPRYGFGSGAALNEGSTEAYLRLPNAVNQTEDPWHATLRRSVGAAPVDIIDSLAALTPWSERGELNESFYNSIGMESYGDWVKRNKGAVEVASGVAGFALGAIGIEMATARLLGSAWFAATGIGQVASRSNFLAQNAQAAASAAMLQSSRSGQIYRWYQGENLAYTLTNVANVGARTAVSETAMMAALSQNSFIWSDDMGDNARNWILGVGLGGLVGGIMARGQIQKWANSPEVLRNLAEVGDPTGLERGLGSLPLSGAGNATSFRESASVTANAIIARRDTARFGGVGERAAEQATIASRREAEAMRGMQSIATRGVSDVPGTQFTTTVSRTRSQGESKLTPAGKHIKDTLADDPTAVYGLDELAAGGGKKNAAQIVNEREAALKETLSSPDATRIQREIARNRQSQTAMVLLDRAWVPIRQASDFLDFRPGKVAAKPTAAGVGEVEWLSPKTGKRFSINEQGGLNRDLEALSTVERLEVAEASNQWLARMAQKKTPFILPKNPTWFQWDMAAEYMQRGGTVDFKHHPGLSTVENIQVKSLAAKYEKIKDLPEIDFAVRDKFNLPKATSFEQIADPNGEILKNIGKASTLDNVSLDDLKLIREEARKAFDLVDETRTADRLDGNMLNYNRAQDGTWYEPLVGFFDDVPAAKWSKFDLKNAMMESASTQHHFLTSSPKSTPFVAAQSEFIERFPHREMAGNISGLADEQVQSTANVVSQAASQFLTTGHKFRNSAPLLAAQQLSQETRKLTENWIQQVIQKLSPYSTAFKSTANRRSGVLMNQYLSMANSWDISDAVQLPDGMWAFRLDRKSKINEGWLGRKVEADEYLRNPATGNIVVLDDLANNARMELQNQTSQLLKEINALRIAKGQKPVKERPFWAPPISTEGKIVGFTLDAAGNPVRGKAIVASSQAEYDRIAKEIQQTLKPEDGYLIFQEKEIRDYVGRWEELGLDFFDPTSAAAPGGSRSGTLSTNRINNRAWDDSLKYLQKNYESLNRGLTELKFAGAVSTARVRAAASVEKAGTRNIWDSYLDTLLGRSPMGDPAGLNAILSPVEKIADQVVAAVWPTGNVSSNHLNDAFNKMGLKLGKRVKTMDELLDLSKDYTPFAHMRNYLEYERGIKTPPTMKKIAQGLNRLGSGVILRWLEVPHAAMNMLGIITNMPGILSARNIPLIGTVKGAPIVDSAKIMGLAFNDMLKKGSHADWEYMVRMGFTGENFAHMHMQMSTIESHSSFARLMVGDPAAAARAKARGKGVSDPDFWRGKGVEGVVSAFTDTSESLSRVWAHFVGLRLSDYHGITGREARHRFANQIANDAIANYDPMNRPEIYQSAFGNMYGLFLSYTQAYYQRLFRYLEDGDWNAMGRNMAVQSGLFGINSLPGSRQFAELVGGQETGDGFLDGLYERFGPAAGSVIANGGFNQITTIFNWVDGVDVPAISLHSRGDINFRHPTSDSILSGRIAVPVGIEIISDIISGSLDILGKSIDPNVPMSARHAAEIAARHMPNRALKGTMTVLASGGQEADAYGNLMATTQGWQEGLIRALGLRSARQQAEIEAYFLNKQSLSIDAERMDRLRTTTRALIREGNFDRLPEVFDGYLHAGGKPWNYSRWIRDMIQDATNTRTQNQMMKYLRSPGNQHLANRILAFTGG